MSVRRWVLLAAVTLLLAGLPAPAGAHGVRHQAETGEATILRLLYHDGTAFAHERVEVRRRGAEKPYVVGETDAHGRFAFVADAPGAWQCRAFSKDGHGGQFEFEIAPPPAASTEDAASKHAPAEHAPTEVNERREPGSRS